MFHCRKLEPQRVGDGPDPELRRAVGAVQGQHEQAADRAHVHDPPAALPDQGQERLDHRDRAEQVDLELPPEVGHRLELDRRRLGDAGVVDQAGQAAIAHGLRDGGRRRRDRRLLRDVDDHRRQPLRGLRSQGLAVLRPPHAGEDVEARSGEVERRGGADARRGAGDDDEAAVRDVAAHPRDPFIASLPRSTNVSRRPHGRRETSAGRFSVRHAPIPCATAWRLSCSCSACSSSCVVGLGFRSKTTFLTVPVNGYGALSS